jgi:hypothetical protein
MIQRKHIQRLAFAMVAVLLGGPANAGQGQAQPGYSGQTNPSAGTTGSQRSSTSALGNDSGEDADRTQRLELDQAKARNNERQKRLVADTERLVKLAGELQADVDKSTKDTLSVDVIRKADEIEKLAHNVKERMKG